LEPSSKAGFGEEGADFIAYVGQKKGVLKEEGGKIREMRK